VAIASAFSGGLFLAVALMHLLPEAGEKFNELKIENNQEDKETFPYPYLITICSFAGILFIEKIITNHKHLHSEV
jgi:zinc transporter 1/2/3